MDAVEFIVMVKDTDDMYLVIARDKWAARAKIVEKFGIPIEDVTARKAANIHSEYGGIVDLNEYKENEKCQD